VVKDNYEVTGNALVRRTDITLRQNLEDQIVQAEKKLQGLKDARDRLEKSGILDTRIEDIQLAMRW
jgi:chaperonin cofactor prefoldin